MEQISKREVSLGLNGNLEDEYVTCLARLARLEDKRSALLDLALNDTTALNLVSCSTAHAKQQ